MNDILSKRVQGIKISPTLAIAAKAMAMQRQGLDVISLSMGEPDFDTPQHIKEAAIAAIQSGFTKYTAVDGFVELKQAIINKFKRENKLDYQLKQILVSVGVKQSIFNLCQALLEAGDEVIIPAPYWVSYPDIVLLCEATPVIIPSTARTRFKITAAQLEQAITPKTKLVFLNSPSNPTGVAYTLDELHALANVLLTYPKIIIATDDIYEHILWSQPFINILNVCPALYPRTVVFNGVSKAYAMTGWRIGYAAGPDWLIAAMMIIQSQSTSNPCSIAQKAAQAALEGGNESIKEMVAAFQARHQYMVERLSQIPRMEVVPADGSFYLFPNVQEIIQERGLVNDVEFASKLLQEEGLAIVPGSAFGVENCVRLSFAASNVVLQAAADRLARFCKKSR